MEKPEFIGRAALEKAKAAGVKRTLVGLEMIERGIARDGYKVLDDCGPRDRLRHQRIARAVSEEEHRAGLCAAGVCCRWAQKLKVEIRGQGVKAQVVPTPFYKRPKKSCNHRGHESTEQKDLS